VLELLKGRGGLLAVADHLAQKGHVALLWETLRALHVETVVVLVVACDHCPDEILDVQVPVEVDLGAVRAALGVAIIDGRVVALHGEQDARVRVVD